MVVESPYQKAKAYTGIMAVMGLIFALSGLSQMLTWNRPNCFLMVFGLLVMITGVILLILVRKYGRKYFSTKSYITGTEYRHFNGR